MTFDAYDVFGQFPIIDITQSSGILNYKSPTNNMKVGESCPVTNRVEIDMLKKQVETLTTRILSLELAIKKEKY